MEIFLETVNRNEMQTIRDAWDEGDSGISSSSAMPKIKLASYWLYAVW
jgi:hypothetical protein